MPDLAGSEAASGGSLNSAPNCAQLGAGRWLTSANPGVIVGANIELARHRRNIGPGRRARRPERRSGENANA
jgi:hypothetical protein